MTTENRLKAKLKAGERVFGTWSMLGSPAVVNVIGHTGLDFVVIDMEHGPMSFETVESQLYAVESTGTTPIVRLGDGSEPNILHALEIGAQSLLVSHVSSAAEARQIVSAAKYYPEGDRGLSPFTRNHGYSDVGLPAKLAYANEQMFLGVLVEGEEGIRNIEEIAQVPGLDMIYLGVYDMAQSAGVAGDIKHPKVLKVVQESAAKIERYGLAAGSVARDQEYLKLLYDSGFRFLSYLVDCAILRSGFETARQWYEELLTGQNSIE
jgi:4-hydroxy-2-oxoheptanedioate aldolase